MFHLKPLVSRVVEACEVDGSVLLRNRLGNEVAGLRSSSAAVDLTTDDADEVTTTGGDPVPSDDVLGDGSDVMTATGDHGGQG